MTDQNNMQAFMEHIQAELDKLPPTAPLDQEAMSFANTYHDYVQEAGDDGDMLYIMVSRLMDKHRAERVSIYAEALTAAGKSVSNEETSDGLFDYPLHLDKRIYALPNPYQKKDK